MIELSGSILTLNAGSSSLKFALFDGALALILRGEVEDIRSQPLGITWPV